MHNYEATVLTNKALVLLGILQFVGIVASLRKDLTDPDTIARQRSNSTFIGGMDQNAFSILAKTPIGILSIRMLFLNIQGVIQGDRGKTLFFRVRMSMHTPTK